MSGERVFYFFVCLFEKGSCCVYTRLAGTLPASASWCWDHTQVPLQLAQDTEFYGTDTLIP